MNHVNQTDEALNDFDLHESYNELSVKNHKVLRIEEITQTEDVYCMTVVGLNNENDRHNFAVLSINGDNKTHDSGVFVKNTFEEDFFIVSRNGNSSKIDTLPGASNLDAI